MSNDAPSRPDHFHRQLGLFDATMLVAGSMIGSGIYIVSADIAREVVSSGWLLVVWVTTAILTVLGALSYAELASMKPHAGGQYVYLRDAYGPMWGFLYGWTGFLVIQTGTIAAVGVAFGKFLGVLAPTLGTTNVLFRVEGLNLRLALPAEWMGREILFFRRDAFEISAGQIVAVAVVLLLTALNCLGVREGKWVQNVFTVIKTGTLILLVFVGLTIAAQPEVWRANFANPWADLSQNVQVKPIVDVWPSLLLAGGLVLSGAMVGSLFSSDAWCNVTFIAGEVKQPERNLPRSLILGTGIVSLLYVLANVAYLAALPIQGAAIANPGESSVLTNGIAHARDDRVGTALMETIFPTWGAPLMALAIMVSTFGCANGLILAGARLYFAMAQDRLFFRTVGRLNARGVPASGLCFQAIWAVVLTFSGSYSELLDYVIFAALFFYALTVSTLFVFRWRLPTAPRPYRTLGYPVLPLFYIIMCAAIMVGLLIIKPVYSWPSFVIVLSGIPVYWLWRRQDARQRG